MQVERISEEKASMTETSPTSVLLLKTKSTPQDRYETLLTELGYRTAFIPVFAHSFREPELSWIQSLIIQGAFQSPPTLSVQLSSADMTTEEITKTSVEETTGEKGEQTTKGAIEDSSNPLKTIRQVKKYGGFIFTSQRAVEPFSTLISNLRASLGDAEVEQLLPMSTVIYTVGPATTRALKTIGLPCAIKGEDTGNGEALAAFILEDYTARSSPLLFVVGETRRDIIPRTLMAESLPPQKRIDVDEVTVYETKVVDSFAEDFSAALKWSASGEAVEGRNEEKGEEEKGKELGKEKAPIKSLWVVVFSPTGCKSMLQTLGLLPLDGKQSQSMVQQEQRLTQEVPVVELIQKTFTGGEGRGGRDEEETTTTRTYIATIGPTTRDFLIKEFGVHAHVCASKPSPEGVAECITAFEQNANGQ